MNTRSPGTLREFLRRAGSPHFRRGRENLFGPLAVAGLLLSTGVTVKADSNIEDRVESLLGRKYRMDRVVVLPVYRLVQRLGAARDVALVPADELAGLIETAHLLRSPRNARRLLAALRRAERGKEGPASVAELRREMLGATGS